VPKIRPGPAAWPSLMSPVNAACSRVLRAWVKCGLADRRAGKLWTSIRVRVSFTIGVRIACCYLHWVNSNPNTGPNPNPYPSVPVYQHCKMNAAQLLHRSSAMGSTVGHASKTWPTCLTRYSGFLTRYSSFLTRYSVFWLETRYSMKSKPLGMHTTPRPTMLLHYLVKHKYPKTNNIIQQKVEW